jgi:hypothetical protein
MALPWVNETELFPSGRPVFIYRSQRERESITDSSAEVQATIQPLRSACQQIHAQPT